MLSYIAIEGYLQCPPVVLSAIAVDITELRLIIEDESLLSSLFSSILTKFSEGDSNNQGQMEGVLFQIY